CRHRRSGYRYVRPWIRERGSHLTPIPSPSKGEGEALTPLPTLRERGEQKLGFVSSCAGRAFRPRRWATGALRPTAAGFSLPRTGGRGQGEEKGIYAVYLLWKKSALREI